MAILSCCFVESRCTMDLAHCYIIIFTIIALTSNIIFLLLFLLLFLIIIAPSGILQKEHYVWLYVCVCIYIYIYILSVCSCRFSLGVGIFNVVSLLLPQSVYIYRTAAAAEGLRRSRRRKNTKSQPPCRRPPYRSEKENARRPASANKGVN